MKNITKYARVVQILVMIFGKIAHQKLKNVKQEQKLI